ncbi:MAG: helicase-exonuclease AddAB subunit AddA, partial [Lachnospiraceae bacterium]|nr:helicase-exonuclease AddAB subunit AddA [Lachnospiraceae bacterium]
MENKVAWTKDQKDVIELRDRDILVSAAAGSGKTAVLVERIIEKITDRKNPCDIDRLLVVTFTKAAAAEMRTRIGEGLEKRLSMEPENEHIQKQMSLLHAAQISTIDSFCGWIVKNYFHVIHLDPVYRIADSADLDLMKQEVLEDLLEEKYAEAKEKKDTVFYEFTEIFSTGRTDHYIEDLILNLYEISTSMPYPEDWIRFCGESYDFSDIEAMEQSEWMSVFMEYLKKNVEIFLEKAKNARNLCMLSDGPGAYLEAVEQDVSFLEGLQRKKTFGEYQELLSKLNPMKLKAVRGKDVDGTIKEKVKSLREGYLKKGILELKEKYFFQSEEEMFSDMKKMAPYVRKLSSLVLDFHRAFSAKKAEEGLVDFSDVEHFALQILVKKGEDGALHKSETALELRGFYDEIMIDEYQDSNEVQELILTSLCGTPGEKPTLFMVGDVKQSIYKFRMAKPEIFLEKYKRFTTGKGPEQRIDLHQNFRSRASVLESANFIFEQIMTEDFGGIAYDDAARLVPGAEFEKTEKRTAGPSEILLIDRGGSSQEVEREELEAFLIGQKIRELVQGENPLYVKGKNGYHPVEYRDISILLRTMSGWSESFVEVLNDMGIPAFAETKTGYFTSLEVETLLNYLHVIDNPRQDIPLAAVLRSVLGRITDEELSFISAMPKRMDFWDQVLTLMEEKPETELGKKLSAFRERLESYQEYAQTRSVYELLQKIYEETGYYHYMSAMPSGEKRKANLDILLEQSVEFAKYGHSGIYRFARYIESLRKANVDFGEASTNSENTNAVRIMSIHKSKGLEFPVVFVAGMGKQFNVMDTRRATLMDGNFGVGCDFIDSSLRIRQPTLFKGFLANRMRLEILEEEVRVLYVALTRAKEKLFFVGSGKGLKKLMENSLFSADESVDYRVLSTATTYLHWILAALLKREKMKNAAFSYLEEASEEEILSYGHFQDELFSLEIFSYQDILALEGERIREEIDEFGALQDLKTDVVYDKEIRELLEKQESYRYPFLPEANLPVKISVSELKRRANALAEKVKEDAVSEASIFAVQQETSV